MAVSFLGYATPSGARTNGNTRIYYATNGAVVASLDLGVTLNGQNQHQDMDCAWDAYSRERILNISRPWPRIPSGLTDAAASVA